MIKFFFIFFISIFYCQNFSYSDDDWFTVTAPQKINSISYSNDQVFLSSNNGLFGYDIFNKNFYFIDDAFKRLDNHEVHIIFYDSYRDHLWLLNKEAIYFKSMISDIWREIDLYSYLNVINSNHILNIGSNYENIFIETVNKILIVNPYNGQLVEEVNKNNFNTDNIIWASTSRSSLSDYVDLRRYFSTNQWNILNRNTLEHKGREIKITCVKEINHGIIFVGTDSGELFIANSSTKNIEKIISMPSITNIHLAYLDNENEWWIADNDWLYSDREFSYEREIIFISKWEQENNVWVEYYQNEYPYILSKDINQIIRFNNFLYIATDYGLLIFDIVNNNWKLYNSKNGIFEDEILDLCIYKDLIYLGTANGLVLFSNILNKPIGYYSNNILKNCKIFDLLVNKNKLYVLSSHGFYLINIELNEYQFLSEKVFFKMDVGEDYFVMSNNAYVYKFYNDEFQLLFRNKNIENIKVIDDYIWLHSKNDAILYNIINDTKYIYNYKDGIIGNIIYNINCNKDWVWFNTNNGISFYNWRKFHNYDK